MARIQSEFWCASSTYPQDSRWGKVERGDEKKVPLTWQTWLTAAFGYQSARQSNKLTRLHRPKAILFLLFFAPTTPTSLRADTNQRPIYDVNCNCNQFSCSNRKWITERHKTVAQFEAHMSLTCEHSRQLVEGVKIVMKSMERGGRNTREHSIGNDCKWNCNLFYRQRRKFSIACCQLKNVILNSL